MKAKAPAHNLHEATPQQIREAAMLIRRGGLVAFPTETVYGLGADAFNPLAVARIFEVKNRPHFDPLIVHIADQRVLETVCQVVDKRALQLMARFWPGPLSLVLRKRDSLPPIVTSGLPTVAVRIPDHPVALALIRAAQTPIAAPSANPFGYLSPTTAQHVQQQLGDRVDLILDGGPSPIGVESTVLDLSQAAAWLLRPGGLALEKLEAVIGPIAPAPAVVPNPLAPGQLPSHYAPNTPIRIIKGPPPVRTGKERLGFLAFQTPPPNAPAYAVVEVLSPTGDLRQAAARLFSILHRMDRAGLDLILAEPVPAVGLGRAIMDRLRRATASRSESPPRSAH